MTLRQPGQFDRNFLVVWTPLYHFGTERETEYFLPSFEKEEILSNTANLFPDRSELFSCDDADCQCIGRTAKFGGNIRHSGRCTVTEASREMPRKVRSAIFKNRDDITAR